MPSQRWREFLRRTLGETGESESRDEMGVGVYPRLIGLPVWSLLTILRAVIRFASIRVGSRRMRTILAVGTVSFALNLLLATGPARTYADDAYDIFSYAPTAYLQYDNVAGYDSAGGYPVITYIASMPSTYGGHFFNGWTAFAQDQTGSLVLFISPSNLTNLTHNPSQTLAVGMGINVGGTYQPFHQIPEIGFYTTASSGHYFQVTSTRNWNALPASPITTISHINTAELLQDSAGYLIELQNVTISGSTGSYSSVFPGYLNNIAEESYTITDNTGSMTMFDWTTSYSECAAAGGVPVPTGPVNLTGFVSYNPGGPAEFTPLLIPEPSAFVLACLGLAGLLAMRGRCR